MNLLTPVVRPLATAAAIALILDLSAPLAWAQG